MAFDELPFAFLHDKRKLVAPNRLSVPLTFDVKDVVVSPMSPYLSAGFAVNHNRGIPMSIRSRAGKTAQKYVLARSAKWDRCLRQFQMPVPPAISSSTR